MEIKMVKRMIFLFFSGWALSQAAQAAPVSAMRQLPTGAQFETADGILIIEPRSDRSIHVKFGKADFTGNYNPAVIAAPAKVQFTVTQVPDGYVLATATVRIEISRDDGHLRFLTQDGKVIVEEGERDLAHGVTQSFRTESLYYGLGQHQNGMLDYANATIHLQQANRDIGIPMIVSPKGYGVLWNNASVTDVDVNQSAASRPLIIRSEAGAGVDYDFIYGPQMDDVVAGYRYLTGDAPMLPRWSWGMWQSKERYKTQDELLAVAKAYRDKGIPLDAVVQDWQYWSPGQWGSHKMDPARFPDPAGMIKTLHSENVHAVISVWPRLDTTTENATELDKAGGLFPKVYPNVYPAGEGRWYDAWNPKARDLYWRQIMNNAGINDWDGWWLDASEAELGGSWGEMRDVQTAVGPGAEVYNSYPLMHTTSVHDGMLRDQTGKRAIILTRSAYAGQQRNAAITWSGDITGDWETLKRQIPAALNFTLSGIPYWSADIGGFFGGKPSDPAYAELFTRWYQFAVFNPMFRVHGTGDGKELYNFDAQTQKTLIDYDKLRYRLLPYIYSASWDVTNNHGTMMRALAFDFRDDTYALRLTDEYMFGKALLVAPVTQAKAATRTVYLPGKDSWFDFWTGAKFAPGQTITAKADIDIPVFVRAGSILPLGPVKQYADAVSAEPIELRVYPGKDGSYELYDDVGDGYEYQKGQYATIKMTWSDVSKRQDIANRKGSYKGMPVTVSFAVQCAGDASSKQLIDYDGKAKSVTIPACQ